MTSLCSIEEVVEEARQGRMFILVDAEERENEGDLVIPAQHCDAAAVNFMAAHGRGLICLALTARRVRELGLPKMARRNLSRHKTAFTVSIEAREGVASGISAHDRAHTIATAIDRNKSGADIVSPGHVFPLIGREGGVLARAGHTEAAIDIARLAGLYPAGVICEVMREDGAMARLPELLEFAARHGLKIAAIADLMAWRRRHDRIADMPHASSGEKAMRPHVVLVEADFYPDITAELVEGAVAALEKAGVSHERIKVAGALEIPAAIALRRDALPHADGFVALGCVIRGQTGHYEIVAGESARGLMTLSLDGVVIGNGVLTVDDRSQAMARAVSKDKGGDAARACLRLLAIAAGEGEGGVSADG